MHARTARARASTDALSHDAKLAHLAQVEAQFGGGVDDAHLFSTPPPIEPTVRIVRSGLSELTWPSAHVPHATDAASTFDAARENRLVRARLHEAPRRHARGPRPTIVVVHGYMGGWAALDEPQWPVGYFHRLGLDVVFPILPFHGPRAGARRGAPLFPSHDPRLTIEGFRQAVSDLRALVAWVRARGAPHVGVAGVSLGGYVVSLLATVEPELDFVLPLTPLASIADFARDQGRLGEGPTALELHAAVESAHRVVDPLARTPLVHGGRALVVGASFDRVTPASHARRIAEHLGCTLLEIPGGHLVQLGRHEAWDAFAALLAREGIVNTPPARR